MAGHLIQNRRLNNCRPQHLSLKSLPNFINFIFFFFYFIFFFYFLRFLTLKWANFGTSSSVVLFYFLDLRFVSIDLVKRCFPHFIIIYNIVCQIFEF